MTPKPYDVEQLKKNFRVTNGKLERLNHNFTNGKWTPVNSICNTDNGYCKVYYNGRIIGYHNIIWVINTGENIKQGFEIDHINGNKIDNNFENLRAVGHRVNQQNRKEHRNGILYGTTFIKKRGKYKAQIKIGSSNIFLGYYKTEKEAHKAYKIACENANLYNDRESFRTLIKGLLLQEKV